MYAKGQCGNPVGRPKVEQIEALKARLMESAPEIIDKAIEMAKEGNIKAMGMVFDRILPSLKAVEISGGDEPVKTSIDMSKVTDEQLTALRSLYKRDPVG
jgi:hypothetical protein